MPTDPFDFKSVSSDLNMNLLITVCCVEYDENWLFLGEKRSFIDKELLSMNASFYLELHLV